MHPVEATLYYTAGCMPAFFGLHPVLALGCIADCAFGAWLGHDGFQVKLHILHLITLSHSEISRESIKGKLTCFILEQFG